MRKLTLICALVALLALAATTVQASGDGYATALGQASDAAVTPPGPPTTPVGPPSPLPSGRPDNTPPVTLPNPTGGGPPTITPPGVVPGSRQDTGTGAPSFAPAGPPSNLPSPR
jgi:hypothetical protein